MANSITLNSNLAALSAQRQLAKSTANLETTFSRLSSGLRINRAVDDAAGLSIASALNADAKVFTSAIRNVNDSISALSVYESAFIEAQSIVVRLQELASQAANGVNTNNQRASLHAEAKALTKEYSRILNALSFNGQNFLGDSAGNFRTQAGYGENGAISGNLGNEIYALNPNGQFKDPVTRTAIGSYGILARPNGRDGYVTFNGIDVVVYNSNGDGTFAAAATFSAASGTDVSVGDFNGDSLTDIIYGTLSVADGLVITVGVAQTNGTFVTTTSAKINVDPSADGMTIYVGDFNGDGTDDAAIDLDHDTTSVMATISANGTQVTGSYLAIPSLSAVEVADVNGDGKDDLLNSIGVELRTATGFTTGATGLGPSAQYGDINGDGIIDAVGISGGTLRHFLGNGDGTFKASTAFISGLGTTFELLDLDNDGVDDILARSPGNTHTRVYLNNGEGSFSLVQTLGNTSVSAAGDFNGDGAMDFFASTQYREGILAPSLTKINVNLRTQAGAREALDILDLASDRISSEIGSVGSNLSRLSSALKNLQSSATGYAEAASQITDVDTAIEAAQLVKTKIFQSAAAAILAQANTQPAIALTLLGGKNSK